MFLTVISTRRARADLAHPLHRLVKARMWCHPFVLQARAEMDFRLESNQGECCSTHQKYEDMRIIIMKSSSDRDNNYCHYVIQRIAPGFAITLYYHPADQDTRYYLVYHPFKVVL
jgi:hypothetical protein